jgi:excinuclease ABC subunit C
VLEPPSALRAHVRAHAENRPGIYRIYGADDAWLYVGKSVRVRTRLLSYFRASPEEKAGELIREATRIEWDYVPDEFGALVREMRLIQRHRPKYNVQHKRKRAYAFVKVTREPAPRILPVTRVIEDGATYYGPFPRVGHVAHTIRDLAHVLGLRDCPSSTPMHFADQLEIFDAERPPRCLRAELASCLAPCCGRVHAAAYRERVHEAHRFLEGRGDGPLRRLTEQMAAAAGRMDYEYAALLRDRLERLRRFREELTAFRGEVAALTFVYRVPGFRGADRLYLIRRGRVRDTVALPKSPRARRKVIPRVRTVFAERNGRGPGALSAHEAAEILLVARWFRLNPEEMERAKSPGAWLADAEGAASVRASPRRPSRAPA